MEFKECVLRPGGECTDCGECEMCDLEPNKVCDNCMRCLNLDKADYRAIEIDEIIMEEKE